VCDEYECCNTCSNEIVLASSAHVSQIKVVKKEEEETRESAAALGMFGQLTRVTCEWHPAHLLCKRMGVPNPYPKSAVVGLVNTDVLYSSDSAAGSGSQGPSGWFALIQKHQTAEPPPAHSTPESIHDPPPPVAPAAAAAHSKRWSRWDEVPSTRPPNSDRESPQMQSRSTAEHQEARVDAQPASAPSVHAHSVIEPFEEGDRPPMDLFASIFGDEDLPASSVSVPTANPMPTVVNKPQPEQASTPSVQREPERHRESSRSREFHSSRSSRHHHHHQDRGQHRRDDSGDRYSERQSSSSSSHRHESRREGHGATSRSAPALSSRQSDVASSDGHARAQTVAGVTRTPMTTHQKHLEEADEDDGRPRRPRAADFM
jgi:hypothetical protein